TNQFQAVPGAPKENAYCLPAVEGTYYMTLGSADGANKGGLSIHMLGNEPPLLREPNFGHGIRFDGWDREEFGTWKRLFLIPRAKLIVVFPPSNDRLELRRFDIDEALEKSSVDYLVVTSRPPAMAKRGAELTYQLTVKSKKGGVKYELSAAPKGMTLSPDGL